MLRNGERIGKERSRHKHLKCIFLLKQDDGNTAVHLALSYGHHKIADILIGAGANTNILNNIGKNAWSIL